MNITNFNLEDQGNGFFRRHAVNDMRVGSLEDLRHTIETL